MGPFPEVVGNHGDWISSVDRLSAPQVASCSGHTL